MSQLIFKSEGIKVMIGLSMLEFLQVSTEPLEEFMPPSTKDFIKEYETNHVFKELVNRATEFILKITGENDE